MSPGKTKKPKKSKSASRSPSDHLKDANSSHNQTKRKPKKIKSASRSPSIVVMNKNCVRNQEEKTTEIGMNVEYWRKSKEMKKEELKERWSRFIKEIHGMECLNEEYEIESICEMLGIEEGPKTGIKLYGYKDLGNIGVYRIILGLIRDFDKKEADDIVGGMDV